MLYMAHNIMIKDYFLGTPYRLVPIQRDGTHMENYNRSLINLS